MKFIFSLLIVVYWSQVVVSSYHWAVRVKGGEDEARAIALKYGFRYIGQVGELDNIYHFVSNDETRSTVAKLQHLSHDQQVGSIQKQEMRMYDKRGFKAPTDPLWTKQWALHSTRNDTEEYNLKVVPAWIQGYTGAGVTVGIVDDGVEHTHLDLMNNYDDNSSFDFIQNDKDASPHLTFLDPNDHGTKCAGLVAMSKNNQKCGVGIAYDAKIAGLRLLSNGVTDILEATALNYHYHDIDIYSNSWGPLDNGFTVEGPRELATLAIEKGASNGRHGKGTIYVWASGNGGGIEKDSCASDGFVNSIYTIAIGSIDNYGKPSYFDEKCSAKLAVTFSYNSSHGPNNPTTTVGGQCSLSFTGTSAAAPLASGIIALTLQANPSLTWRDVQYLIVYTSNSNLLMTANGDQWITNGIGLHVSSQFGFGVIDAEAMVTRAKGWINVPNQIQQTVTPSVQSRYVSNGSSVTIQWTPATNITYLEHVILQLSLQLVQSPNEQSIDYDDYYNALYNDPDNADSILYHNNTRRGDITITLTSPLGTKSMLLPFRDRDFISSTGYNDWPFMSVQFWGESPVGDWKCTVSYRGTVGSVKIRNIQFKLYGVYDIPESISNIPTVCPSSCLNNRCSSLCDSCKELRDSQTLQCISSCPNDTYPVSKYCVHDSLLTSSFIQPTATVSSMRGVSTHHQTTTSSSLLLTSPTLLIIDTVLDKPKEDLLKSDASKTLSVSFLTFTFTLITILIYQ